MLLPQTLDPLVSLAVEAIRGETAEIHLHLFEGINTPLLMSMIAIASGFVLFLLRKPLIAGLQRAPEFNPVAIYNWLFNRALLDGADWLTTRLQNGRLRFYMMVVIVSFLALTITLIFAGQFNVLTEQTLVGIDWRIAFLCLMLMVGSVVGVIAPTRLSAVVVLGIEGALLALLFAIFGAPDLAFTQLMIEVITLVLFVLAFHFLPDAFNVRLRRLNRAVDVIIAGAAGFTITALILVANAVPVAEPISGWYVENAETIGQGHNVVNIILVDFRGIDTLGEITVLIIAAIGVTALLRLRPTEQPRGKFMPTGTEHEPEIALPSENQTRVEADGEEEPV